MGVIVGQVTRVKPLPAREEGGESDVWNVVVETVEFLYRPNGADVPVVGCMVRGEFSVWWPRAEKGGKSKRPVRWLGDWEKARFV